MTSHIRQRSGSIADDPRHRIASRSRPCGSGVHNAVDVGECRQKLIIELIGRVLGCGRRAIYGRHQCRCSFRVPESSISADGRPWNVSSLQLALALAALPNKRRNPGLSSPGRNIVDVHPGSLGNRVHCIANRLSEFLNIGWPVSIVFRDILCPISIASFANNSPVPSKLETTFPKGMYREATANIVIGMQANKRNEQTSSWFHWLGHDSRGRRRSNTRANQARSHQLYGTNP